MISDFYNLPDDKAILISAKGLIINNKGQALLMKVPSKGVEKQYAGKWDLPGGLVDYDEIVTDGLKREIAEESGLTAVKIVNLVAEQSRFMRNFVFKNGSTKDVRIQLLVYLCKYDGVAEVKLSDEHIDYKWFSYKDTCKLDTLEGVKEILTKCLSALERI